MKIIFCKNATLYKKQKKIFLSKVKNIFQIKIRKIKEKAKIKKILLYREYKNKVKKTLS